MPRCLNGRGSVLFLSPSKAERAANGLFLPVGALVGRITFVAAQLSYQRDLPPSAQIARFRRLVARYELEDDN